MLQYATYGWNALIEKVILLLLDYLIQIDAFMFMEDILLS